MTRDGIIANVVLIGYILINMTSCSVNYEKHIKKEIKQIPVAVQFIEENEEFLNALLAVSYKLQVFTEEFNVDMEKPNIFYFDIYYSNENKDTIIRENVIGSGHRSEMLSDANMKTLVSEYENYIIHETMSTKMNSRKGNNGSTPIVLIYADHVTIEYHSYLSARLAILSPPIEIEETNDYRMYKYGIKVNDSWGLYLRRDGHAN
jgi:hypothetical protein